MASGSVELSPIHLNDNTEVKVPINASRTTETASEAPITLEASQPTSFDYLIDLFRSRPTELFISRVLLNYASSEPDLEKTRDELFGKVKILDSYVFGEAAELKKRVYKRNGDPICVKLATDIHTLISILEGEDMSSLKEMISTSRRRLSMLEPLTQTVVVPPAAQDMTPHRNLPNAPVISRNNVKNNVSNICQCQSEVKLLKDQISSMQADILMIKQSLHVNEKLRSDQIKVVSDTINSIKSDIQNLNSKNNDMVTSVKDSVHEISTCNGALGFNIKCILGRVEALERFLDNKNIHVVQIHNNQHVQQRNVMHTQETYTSCIDQPDMTIPANVTSENVNLFGNMHVPCKESPNNLYTSVDEIAYFLSGRYTPCVQNERQCTMASETNVHPPEQDVDGINRDASVQTSDRTHHIYDSHVIKPINTRLPEIETEPEITSMKRHVSVQTKEPAYQLNHGNMLDLTQEKSNEYINSSHVIDLTCDDNVIRSTRDGQVLDLTNEEAAEWDSDVNKSDFELYQYRRRTKHFFVGGFRNTVDIDRLSHYVTRKGPKVTTIRKFPCRNWEGRCILRLNVWDDDNADRVLSRDFWPRDGIVVRPWRSREARTRRNEKKRDNRSTYNSRVFMSRTNDNVRNLWNNRWETLSSLD